MYYSHTYKGRNATSNMHRTCAGIATSRSADHEQLASNSQQIIDLQDILGCPVQLVHHFQQVDHVDHEEHVHHADHVHHVQLVKELMYVIKFGAKTTIATLGSQ